MLRAIAPRRRPLDRRFATLLASAAMMPRKFRAFLAITPAAASSLRSLPQFLEQVEYNGRRLAKLKRSPSAWTKSCGSSPVCLTRCSRATPAAREAAHLATIPHPERRLLPGPRGESQAFFGLYHAETEAAGLEDLLRRIIRILTPAFQASAGRLLLLDRPTAGNSRARSTSSTASPMSGSSPIRRCADAMLPIGRTHTFSGAASVRFSVRYPWLPREMALRVAAGERCHEALQRARLEVKSRRLGAEARRAEEEERPAHRPRAPRRSRQSMLLLRLQLENDRARRSRALAPTAWRKPAPSPSKPVAELRRLVAALSPAVLERLGLKSALRQLAARFRKTTQPACACASRPPASAFPCKSKR